VNQFIADWFSSSDEMVLQTSGSTGEPKSIKVKKEWMKNSAQLTGKTFELMEGDSTLLCMPMKYVAGKMTVVRALELELDLKVIEPCSNPLKNINKPINFAAMVPLQLENTLNDLDKIKTLIVGGGQVNSKLVEKLQNVSTQVYETYGMTETLTHVAIKPLNGPSKSDVFRALDDIHFELDARECLVIHATALNPEPIVTNDLVDLIDENSFRWLGRYDNVINSGGIKIIPEVVEAKLSSIVPNRRFFIAGKSDKSLGEKVVLVVEGKSMDISCKSLDKFEQPKEIHFIPEFVETKSGKIHRQTTLSLI
jgi:O-succinylbenzoic acid--CoA ligase